jgi:hypothetical protein
VTRPRAFDGFPKELWADFGPYQAVVDRNEDGDSFFVLADAGLDETPHRWIRLENYSSPEKHEPGGPEDAEATARIAPPGTPLRITTKKRERVRTEVRSFVRYVARAEVLSGDAVGDLGELLDEDRKRRSMTLEERIVDVLENAPEGLTGPQIHSIVPGSWGEVKAALEQMVEDGRLEVVETRFSDEHYVGYALATD